MDSEFDRKVAANVPTGVPGRGHVAGEAALHGGAAADRRRSATPATWRRHGRTWCRRSASTGRGRPRPPVRLLPRDAARRRSCPRASSYPERGIAIGIDETTLEPVFVDFETRPVLPGLRRERVRQVDAAAAARQADHRAVHAGRRRGSWSATTGARCSAACPASTCCEYAPMAPQLQEHMERLAGRWAGGCRARTSRRSSCATAAGGPGRSCSSSSTTTTWWRPAAATRWRRCWSTCRSPVTSACASSSRAALGRAGRSLYEPFMQRIKELGAQGLDPLRRPGRGRAARQHQGAAAAARTWALPSREARRAAGPDGLAPANAVLRNGRSDVREGRYP